MSEQEKNARPALSLAEMRDIDIKTVDRSTLVDMNTVKIDASLPQKERMQEFIRQIKNPYCYLDQGIVVKVLRRRKNNGSVPGTLPKNDRRIKIRL